MMIGSMYDVQPVSHELGFSDERTRNGCGPIVYSNIPPVVDDDHKELLSLSRRLCMIMSCDFPFFPYLVGFLQVVSGAMLDKA